ncbi:MAG TPA: RodZ domain-containing protein [Streptosporangiaceae bacterium]|nr:RodZ domain-containing protein [Streptosporangiaceae bacterium]
MSIGDALAEARSQAGLTITQVSQRTCIRETIIRGIEHNDFSACGGDFYARGHIRSIARVVGLDPEELIREYDATHGAPEAIRAADVFEPATPIKLKERRSPNWTVAMIVVLVLVLGYGVYRAVAAVASPHHPAAVAQTGARQSPAPAAHSPTPTPTPSPTQASHTVVIRLTAIEDCWVEFTKPDGAYLSQAYILGGNTMTWKFHHAVTMQIGNPGGILLTVNGQNLARTIGNAGPVTLSLGPGKKLSSQQTG